jgi:hypothetical protein
MFFAILRVFHTTDEEIIFMFTVDALAIACMSGSFQDLQMLFARGNSYGQSVTLFQVAADIAPHVGPQTRFGPPWATQRGRVSLVRVRWHGWSKIHVVTGLLYVLGSAKITDLYV